MVSILMCRNKEGAGSLKVKTWLIMRLITLFLFVSTFQVNASGLAQSISFTKTNAFLPEVFKEIERQTGYLFFYDKALMKAKGPVHVRVRNATLDEALKVCLRDHQLSYSIVRNTVVIFSTPTAAKFDAPFKEEAAVVEEPADIVVTGRVVNDKGEPLEGVNVKLKGSSVGTITDANGRFSIRVPDANAALEISNVGYATQEIRPGVETYLNIKLEITNTALNEVVVVGYGTSSKANLSGSVSTVDVADVTSSRPLNNVASIMEGQVSGVFIHQNSSQPGAEGMNILIRGQGSMGDSQPLVIIDGMESAMDNINPLDIESISILKDAASASIYGTRAANGVILITTKRGKSGAPQIRYNAYAAKQKPTAVPDFLGSADYARLHNEARKNAGLTPTFTDEVIAKYEAGNDPNYPSTDWMSVLYSGKAYSHNHSLGVSGGNDRTRYNLSLGYNEEKGIIKSVDADLMTMRLNLDNKISERISIGLNTALSRAVNTIPLTGPELTRGGDLQQFYNSVTHIPPTQKLKLEDGSWSGEYPLGNLAAWIANGNLRKTIENKLVNTLFADIKLFEGLNWRNRASVDYTFSEITNHISQFTYGGGQVSGPASNQEDVNRNLILDMESLLTYSKKINAHKIKVLLGTSGRSESFATTMAYRLGFPSNDLSSINAGSTDGLRNGGYKIKSTLGSYFTRLNYDFNGKYLFEANLRRDGSSKFADGHRWGWFPSFSAAWNLTGEKFLDNVGWLNALKLRGSWGRLGNHRISDFMFMQRIALGQNYTFGGPVAIGAAQVVADNPNITWEKTSETNLGVDFRFFNRLSGSIDLYHRYTDDILTVVPVSASYGLPAPTVNAGAMSNKGIETEIRYAESKGKFRYDVSVNASYNKNRVEKYHGRDIFEVNAEGGAIVREKGIPWNSYIGYEWIGYFMSDEEAGKSAVHHPSVGAGDLKFKDQNGDGKIDGQDRVILGKPVPSFTYGLNAGFNYKNFDFGFFFHGVSDVQRYIRVRGYMPFMRNGKALAMHLDRMIVENGVVVKEGYFPKTLLEGGEGGKNIVSSGFTIHNASYLRMKNIQLGYTFPANLTNRIFINRARVYVSGQNLLTVTKFPDGYDPEANTTAFHGHILGGAAGWSYPQAKSFTVGLDVNF
jgi:TonB-linked SusC/RagA family outer membrane protein